MSVPDLPGCILSQEQLMNHSMTRVQHLRAGFTKLGSVQLGSICQNDNSHVYQQKSTCLLCVDCVMCHPSSCTWQVGILLWRITLQKLNGSTMTHTKKIHLSNFSHPSQCAAENDIPSRWNPLIADPWGSPNRVSFGMQFEIPYIDYIHTHYVNFF